MTADTPRGTRRHSTWKWLVALAILAALLTLAALVVTDRRDTIVLEESRVTRDAMGQRVLSGTFRNRTTDRVFDSVRVDVELLDRADSVVGTMAAVGKDLGPGQTWRFFIPVARPEVVKFRLVRLHCTSAGQAPARMCPIGAPVIVDGT